MGLGAKTATNALTATDASGTERLKRTKKDAMCVDYKRRKLVKTEDQVTSRTIVKLLEEENIEEILKKGSEKDST